MSRALVLIHRQQFHRYDARYQDETAMIPDSSQNYSDNSKRQYGFPDTWNPYDQIRWRTFQGMSSSYAWGVWGGWSFRPLSAPTLTPIILKDLTLQGGAFQFGFTNVPGESFSVFTTTNAASAFTNWTRLGSVTETSSGHFQFVDSNANGNPVRFYRVTAP